ncbi:MAG: CoB--CoM heterodisulfide reductase iron-sulfur subunit B family protein [Thermoleophilia bacterium]
MSGPRTDRREGIAYYPGCSLTGTSREFDESLRAVASALDIEIHEIDDWSCCGASSGHMTDHLLGVALPARNLALAEAEGFEQVVAPCAACYNRLASSQHEIASDAQLAERIPEVLGRPFRNSVEVVNANQLLRDAATTIRERVAARGKPNPLIGVKLAAYYGCLLVRPAAIAGGEDPENPSSIDEVIRACGADPIDWNMKVECCGASLSFSRTASVVRLGRSIISDARANGAEAIVVACPLCHSNLDLRQKAMAQRGQEPLPVLFITQLVGLALGIPPSQLGLDRHFVPTAGLVTSMEERAVVREAEEARKRAEAAAKAAARAEKAAAPQGGEPA